MEVAFGDTAMSWAFVSDHVNWRFSNEACLSEVWSTITDRGAEREPLVCGLWLGLVWMCRKHDNFL